MSANSSFGELCRESSPDSQQSSKKWVTFDDLIDDAMESGKLSPRRKSRFDQMTRSQTFDKASPVILPPPPPVEKRRNSVCLSSSGSEGGSVNGAASPTNVDVAATKGPLDFSQSMGNPTEEFQVYSVSYTHLTLPTTPYV